jgi:hypothetical protein
MRGFARFEALEEGVAVNALDGGAVFLESLAFGLAAAFAALPAVGAAVFAVLAHVSILARLALCGAVCIESVQPERRPRFQTQRFL